MKTQLIKTETNLWENFKRTMYALMIMAVAVAIPLLSYLALSYNNNSDEQKGNTIKVKNLADSPVKGNTVKL